jgi:hypothetical protein
MGGLVRLGGLVRPRKGSPKRLEKADSRQLYIGKFRGQAPSGMPRTCKRLDEWAAGPTELRTAFPCKDQHERGAYYVYVERLAVRAVGVERRWTGGTFT